MQQRIRILDHGFVELRNMSGPTRRPTNVGDIQFGEEIHIRDFDADDTDPANTARMSFDQMDSGRTREMDLKLCDYLMKNKHTSPFEMIEVWIEMKMPIFLARQFVRHRTASINEVSGRYVQLPAEWYIPEKVGKKAKDKKQGQEGDLYWQTEQQFKEDLNRVCAQSYQLYNNAIMTDVAPEHARLFLHLNHYTHWIWKQDLHNLMHFLSLRVDSHAQIEANVYAEAIISLIEPHLPHSMALFRKYRMINMQSLATEAVKNYKHVENRIPTHICQHCQAMWIKNRENGSWSLFSPNAGTCCDNSPEFEKNVCPIDITVHPNDFMKNLDAAEPLVPAIPPYHQIVLDLAKSNEAIIAEMGAAGLPVAHLQHMAIGVAGESIELLEAYLANDKETMLEELGDAEFFIQGADNALDVLGYGNEQRNVAYAVLTPTEVIHDYLIAAGNFLDSGKRLGTYVDETKIGQYKANLIAVRIALNHVYEVLPFNQEQAIAQNIYKLVTGPKARYKGGVYSNAAAQNRADKQ